MRNAFLAFLSIIVTLFIIACFAIIIVISVPDFSDKVFSFLGKSNISRQVDEEENNSRKIDYQQEQPLREYSYKEHSYSDNTNHVDIKYPIITGLTDTVKETEINFKIGTNATSIVKLYPVNTKYDYINVKFSVEELSNDRIVIVYEGQIDTPNVKANKSSQKKQSTKTSDSSVNSSTGQSSGNKNYGTYNGSSKYSDNPTNNYQIPGASYIPYAGTTSNNQIAGNVSGLGSLGNTTNNYSIGGSAQSGGGISYNDSQAPISAGGAMQGIAGTNYYHIDAPVSSYANTETTEAIKIFFTNVIDLKTGVDYKLSDIIDVNSLAQSVYSGNIEVYKANVVNTDEIKKYIKDKLKISDLVRIFNDADFRIEGVESWPKCFSYMKDDSIYFSIPLTSNLGDYAVLCYKLDN